MIKIKKSDSIIDIINKITNSTDKSIILEFPFWHLILHNYLSLKILKNKADRKDLIIVTSDLTSKKIWEPLWIKYTIIKKPEFIKEKNILKYNYSFFEYFRFEVKKHILELKSLVSKNKQLNKIKKYKSNHSWLGFFILTLWISILLLLFIFYFTVNKTYIYITPEIEVKTKSKNLIFKTEVSSLLEDTSKTIKLEKVNDKINITENFKTSWINEKDIKRSKWKAKLFNTTNENIELVSWTRLQTWSGIVYKIDWKSFIPKARLWSWTNIIPWKTIVNIISKIRDSKWKIIWKRWNIGSWVFLTVPWLKDKNNRIYAKTIWIIKWWSSYINRIVTKTDIKNANIFLEEKLRKDVLEKLKLKILKNNKNNKTNFNILDVNDIITYKNLDIQEVWNIKIWEKRDNFTLTWSIDIETYIYNSDNVVNKLRNTIKDLSLKDIENILLIDNKSLRVSNVIYKRKKPFSVKATMELQVYYSQNFLSKNSAYIERLKWTILWINKHDAKQILLNDKKISNVEIQTRPFFINKVSSLPSNIILKIQE